MLNGARVSLRAVERDDLRRLHELQRNVDLVVFGDGSWDPISLAAFEQQFDKALAAEQLYHDGRYVDSVFMGLLRREWQARQGERA